MRSQFVTSNRQWYFAIVDVIEVLTQSADANAYWRKLKKRLKKEGDETVTICNALKMTAADGKQRRTDVPNTEQLLRLVQSIPSPKAEPFKLWLSSFPDWFSFVPKNKELIDLKFQIGRSSSHSGRRNPPRVSTEHGALMAISGKTPISDGSAKSPIGFSSFFHSQSIFHKLRSSISVPALQPPSIPLKTYPSLIILPSPTPKFHPHPSYLPASISHLRKNHDLP